VLLCIWNHSFACQNWCVINGKCIHLCQRNLWYITCQKFLSPDILCTSHHVFVLQLFILMKESKVPKHSNLINCELWQNMQATLITKKMGSSNIDLRQYFCLQYPPFKTQIGRKIKIFVATEVGYFGGRRNWTVSKTSLRTQRFRKRTVALDA